MQISNKIFALDTDPRISEIRNEIGQHTDAIPYMLLPVRTETKFRTIELTPALTNLQAESIIEAIGEIHLLTVEVLNKINAIKLRLINTRLGDVVSAISSAHQFQVREKGWIKQVYNALKIDLQQLLTTITTAFPPEAQDLRKAMSAVDIAIDQAAAIKDRKDALGAWIADFTAEANAFALLAGPITKIPFINIKNKKDLYLYVERRFQNLLDFFGRSKEALAAVKNVDANQFSAVKKLGAQLREMNGVAGANLATVHADAAWQGFVEGKVKAFSQQLSAALEFFDNVIIAFLETLPPPPAIQSGDLIVHGVLTLVQLKKFNTNPSKGFEKLKRFRQYLQPRIDLLEKALAATVVETRPGHIETIKKMYGSLGTSLQETSLKMSAFTSTNASHNFGKQLTTRFVKEKVSPIINALKGQAIPGRFPGVVIVPRVPALQYQLCIRIYPDDIMVMTHDPALTEMEVNAGQQFWKTWWAASRDKDLEKAAWSVLHARFGTRRASWIVRSLKPAVSNPVNKAAYDTRPSDKLTDIINLIQGNIDQLKNLPAGKPVEVFSKIATVNSFKAVLVNCNKSLSLIKTIAADQDFLVNKLGSLVIQFASQLNALVEKSHTLTEPQMAQCLAALSALETVLLRSAEFDGLTAALGKTAPAQFTGALADPFEYPVITIKEKDWNRQPYCGGMPDRFVAVSYNNGICQHIKVGNTVTPELPVGIDPNQADNAAAFTPDANGNLQVPDTIQWMFDYDKAVEEGMAITLTLSKEQYDKGFDKLIIIGTSNMDAAAGQAMAEKLFTNHIYAEDGLDFLKVGTPTNNTEERKSGYKTDDDADERYRIEVAGTGVAAVNSDGQRLARALGMNELVIQSANYAGNTEINRAAAMNRALFNGTIGHYMEEMFDTIFTYDNIRRTEKLFLGNCMGRGYLPSIRAGMQPYGILPTTAFSRLQMDTQLRPLKVSEMNTVALPFSELSERLQHRFEYRLHQLLMILYHEYSKLAEQHVINYSNLNKAGADVSDRFTQMLCLHPVSMNYFFRQSINIARGPNATGGGLNANYKATDTFGPNGLFEQFKMLMFQGVNHPSMFFYDEASPDPVASAQRDKVFSRIKEQFISSRNFGNRMLDITSPVSGEIVTDAASFTEPLKKTIPSGAVTINYIEWLLSRTADQLLAGNAFNDPARIPNKSMLFLMLRQSLLQAYQEAALEILQREKFFTESERRNLGSRFMYYFRKYNPVTKKFKNIYVTKWHALFKHFTELPEILRDSTLVSKPFYTFVSSGAVKSMGRYLDQVAKPAAAYKLFAPSHKVHFEKLRSVRDAIASLASLPAAELELLLGEHIDLSTHRLDAWLLALVNQRLSQQRASRPQGLFTGAYGYLENLRRDTNRTAYNQPVHADFKLNPAETVYHDADNQGFIHAPSIGQAITAAVMRSAYMGNISGEDERNRLSVNLSSSRIRMALKLIEGMNNNQSVNALLGFQFEKGLHERYREAEMDKFIQPFRKKYPLKQKVEEIAQDQAAYESLVTDGLALLERCQQLVNWDELKDIKTLGELLSSNFPPELDTLINGLVALPAARASSKKIIIEEIDRMADAFDALGDLALSESVYQIVQGNHVRAAAVLDALAKGKNIPDPQVIDTLRSGLVVTHRVVLNLPTNMQGNSNRFSAPAGWPATATLLAATEPSLNQFLGAAFGNAAQYKCLVTVTDSNNMATQASMGLDELQLQPIDLFSLTGGMEELKAIITHRQVLTQDAGTTVQVDFLQMGPSARKGDKPVAQLFFMMAKVAGMLSNARYAGAHDMLMPDSVTDHSNEGNHNVAEFEQRVFNAFTTLQQLQAALLAAGYIKDVLDGKTAADKVLILDTDYLAMLAFLDRALQCGISNVYGSGLVIDPVQTGHYYTVHRQVLLVTKEINSRVASALALKNSIATITKPSLKIKKLQELGTVILGKNKMLLPVYQLSNTAAISTQLSLPGTEKITRKGGLMAVEKWMQGLARVRAAMNQLMSFLQCRDMLGHTSTELYPVQLPFTSNDYWLGIEYPENYHPKGDKLSVVMIHPSLATAQSWNSGLVLDEWVEIIPVKEETSGIVFNYNQPNATPPQSVLLAVTPTVTNRWEWDDLVHTIIDTVELGRIRAVEPDHINQSFLSLALNAVVGEIPPPQLIGDDPNALGVQAVMDFSIIKKPAE